MKMSSTLQLFCLTATCILLLAGCANKPVPAPLETQSQIPAKPVQPSDVIEQAISASQPVQNIVLERVHFAFDKYSLSPEAQDILSANASALQTAPGLKIRIEGHCDDHGSDEYNLALGERRAQSVRTYLMSLGIAADRLETISFGEEMPIDFSNNEIAWAKNRRAEFKVLN